VQGFAGTLDALLDGFFAGAERLGDLAKEHPPGVGHFDDFAELIGQSIEAAGESLDAVAEGVALDTGDVVEVSLERFEHLGLATEHGAGGLAPVIEHEIPGDAPEPGAERAGVVVVGQAPPGDEQRFLKEVVDDIVPAHEGAQKGGEHVGMLADEDLEDLAARGAWAGISVA
jgi:hypothetical protein